MVEQINILALAIKHSTTVKVPLNRWDMVYVYKYIKKKVCLSHPEKIHPQLPSSLPEGLCTAVPSSAELFFFEWVEKQASLSLSHSGRGRKDRMEGSMLLAEALFMLWSVPLTPPPPTHYPQSLHQPPFRLDLRPASELLVL